MIPKIIHFCWFGGGEKPRLANKCIKSWHKYFPNYEIKEWNEGNFNLEINSYFKEAYEAKKYAFCSDYARFWILYNYGGLYFDTDVEVINSFEGIVSKGSFMGCEEGVLVYGLNNYPPVAPGLCIGCEPQMPIIKEILDYYSSHHFKDEKLKSVVRITTEILIKHGLQPILKIQECAGLTIYPKDYFCPISYLSGEFIKTKNTVSIHHYAASWLPWDEQLIIKLNIKYYAFKTKHPRLFYYLIYIPQYKYHSIKNKIIKNLPFRIK